VPTVAAMWYGLRNTLTVVQHIQREKLCVADEMQPSDDQGDPKPRGLPSGKIESDLTQGQPPVKVLRHTRIIFPFPGWVKCHLF
jgi:hypothetical protein